MLNIQKFVFNPFSENTYLLWDSDLLDALIIDPGMYEPSEEQRFSSFVENKNLNLKFLINTHSHIDHILGNAFIKSKYNTIFLAPKEDEFLFDIMDKEYKNFGMKYDTFPKADKYITENEPLIIGNSKGKFIFTPGHTPGEFCLYFEKEKICFTGDVLFREGIGRTDLWGGNYDTLTDSIKNKLYLLPENVKIFPGHGPESTIGYEKRNNPFVHLD